MTCKWALPDPNWYWGVPLCSLHKDAKVINVPPRGAANPIVLFVGEAPGKTEDRAGSTFIGKSGQVFNDLMRRAGLDPTLCRWTNIVRCVPWESRGLKVRPPTQHEVDACCMHLEEELRVTRPVFVVPLGASASAYFLGEGTKISQVRGKRFSVEIPTLRYRYLRMLRIAKIRGIEDDSLLQEGEAKRQRALEKAITKYGIPDVPTISVTVLPTWHPASILYGNKAAEYDILSDLNYVTSQITREKEDLDYQTLTTVEDMVGYLRKLRSDYRDGKLPFVAYDLETTSLSRFDPKEYITTIGFSHEKGVARVIPWDHHESPIRRDKLAQAAVLHEMNAMFEEVPVGGHHLKFDITFGVIRRLLVRKIYDDSQEQAWTLFNDTTPHDLDYLASRFTDLNLPKQEMQEAQALLPKDMRYNTDNYPLDLVSYYNGGDCDSVIRLIPALEDLLVEEKLYEPHKDLTVNCIIPTGDMEITGCPLDQPFLKELRTTLGAEIDEHYRHLDELGIMDVMDEVLNEPDTPPHKRKSFKVTSPDSLSILLYEVLDLKPRKFGSKVRKNGKYKGRRAPSADKHVRLELLEEANAMMYKYAENPDSSTYKIWRLRKEVLESIQAIKDVWKLYNDYAVKMPEKMDPDGYVRPTYGIRHTGTGRFNCVDPSFHTIPWHSVIKRAFVSRFLLGLILAADFSQMELRMFAAASRDPDLIQAYIDGRDLHRLVASRVLRCAESDVGDDDRRRIKTINFGLLYGRGPASIALQEAISPERAKEIIDSVFNEFPRIKEFIAERHAYVMRHGSVNYINGFRRLIPVDPSDPSRAKRQAVNSSIQGPASDMAARGLVNMHRAIKKLHLWSRLFEFKHDDLGFDVAPGELYLMMTLVQKEMVERAVRQSPFVQGVPLKVDYELGVSWGHLVSAKLLPGNEIILDGEEDCVAPLVERLEQWLDPPEILDTKIEVKKKAAVVRSLMRSTGEKVDYNHVTTRVRFPTFVRREPEYKYPGLTTWYEQEAIRVS